MGAFGERKGNRQYVVGFYWLRSEYAADRVSPHMLGREVAPRMRHVDGDSGTRLRTMPVSQNAGLIPSVQAGRYGLR